MDGDRQQTETIPGRYEDAALGFRNHWYPAMLSDEIIEEQLVPLTLLGENLLFKRIDGVVYAIADQCIHRGFRFSTKQEQHHLLAARLHLQLQGRQAGGYPQRTGQPPDRQARRQELSGAGSQWHGLRLCR